ncbi:MULTISPECIES: alpha/beta fold hydrolase [Nocardiopsis]|uniref:Alpha/beta hydrolase n=1 Tax=Nocardiopsis sinuspersici TaxID=501010 RepID=A0A1V3C6R1_9ACTN|nr:MULTISPECIES: alpha/beta hydrolase [Nocardiopsis]OOC56441.1 alpha/beta hydrolase [Nocardiopsis sinuspersici]
MPDSNPQGVRVYRSEAGAREIRAWCERRLADWPGLDALPELDTALGATRAFRARGGDATPALVLSGTNFNSATSVDTARVIARDREVLLADLPGQPGLSAGVRPRANRASAYGRWFDEVLPRLTERPVTVLAHSLGAVVALNAKPSPLVHALVLVGPAGLTTAAKSPELMRAALPWMIGPRRDKSTRLLNFMSGPAHVTAGTHPYAEWMTLVGRHCRTSLAPGPLPMECLRPWEDTPVVVATGSHDTFYSPARLHGPARRFLDADVAVMEGAGHLALNEQPERVAELLRSVD